MAFKTTPLLKSSHNQYKDYFTFRSSEEARLLKNLNAVGLMICKLDKTLVAMTQEIDPSLEDRAAKIQANEGEQTTTREKVNYFFRMSKRTLFGTTSTTS